MSLAHKTSQLTFKHYHEWSVLTIPFLDVVGGFTDISGQLLELYKLRRDGSFFEQQQFLADIQEKEARLTEAHSNQRELLLAQLGERRANSDELRAAERDLRNARLAIASKAYADRMDRNFANSPFEYSPEEIFARVDAAISDRKQPVLLIAPFLDDGDTRDESDKAPPAFRVGIRREWMASPWVEDLTLLDGLISRPLRNTDVDLMIIREVLRDLPVVLIYGEIQRGRRVWCSIVSWNLLARSRVGSIAINLPGLPLPAADDAFETEALRLEFEDAMGQTVVQVAGVISQWFHIANYSRLPRFGRIPQGLDAVLCASLASAFEIAAENHPATELPARVHQANLYDLGGIKSGTEAAVLRALEVVDIADAAGQVVDLKALRSLIQVIQKMDNSMLQQRATRHLEAASRAFIFKYLDLGES